jgi:hypothetical protein
VRQSEERGFFSDKSGSACVPLPSCALSAGQIRAGIDHQGFDVTVLEQQRRPGGRANVIEEDGFRVDTGQTITPRALRMSLCWTGFALVVTGGKHSLCRVTWATFSFGFGL